MSDSRIPTEVELVYELMPCNAMRVAQEAVRNEPHACGYFRQWGTYNSYDYASAGAPKKRGIVQKTEYIGRAALAPEMLSGCRKSPIMAVGINPNLPGWWPFAKSWINPLFDEYKQYAHYFRYRETAKLHLREADYEQWGGPAAPDPFKDPELNVPAGEGGKRIVEVEERVQSMYRAYQNILDGLASEMGWENAKLEVGEDLAYINMVACPSAKWTTVADKNDPKLPPMTTKQRDGIVGECFRERRYFLRQLFQSLPTVLLVFSQSTTNALLAELGDRFYMGNPKPGDKVEELIKRDVRIKYGELPNGQILDAVVLFAPHPTGNKQVWEAAREEFMGRLVDLGKSGRLALNPQTKHLARPAGSCVFCTMLEIGDCDYLDEIKPLAQPPVLMDLGAPAPPPADKSVQAAMLQTFLTGQSRDFAAWDLADDAVTADTGKVAE